MTRELSIKGDRQMKWKPISEIPELKRELLATDGKELMYGSFCSRQELREWKDFYCFGEYAETNRKPTHWMYVDDLLMELPSNAGGHGQER